MRKLLPFLAFMLIVVSCKKDNKAPGDDLVEFYLVETLQPVSGRCEVDAFRTTLQTTPFITNDEIVGYNTKTHEFKLSVEGWQKAETLRYMETFAVTVNKEVIYFAVYKPGHSNSSCDHSITAVRRSIIPRYTTEEMLEINLGYPNGNTPGIEDKRNNFMLIAALGSQHKLL